MSDFTPETEAQSLCQAYGNRAKQIVFDSMLQAIRECDMAAARRWEHVADVVDRLLKQGWSDEALPSLLI